MGNGRILCCPLLIYLTLALALGSLVGLSPAWAAVTVASRLTTVSTMGSSTAPGGFPNTYSDSKSDASTAPGVYPAYAASGGFEVSNFSHGEAVQNFTLATASGGLQVSLAGTSLSMIDVTLGGSAQNSTSNTFVLDFSLGESSFFSFTGSLDTDTIASGSTSSSSPTVLASLQNVDTSVYVANVTSEGSFSVTSLPFLFPPPPGPIASDGGELPAHPLR